MLTPLSAETPVPMPEDWSRLWTILKQEVQDRAIQGAPEPPRPMILAGAAFSTPEQVRARWVELVDWCKEWGLVDVAEHSLPDPPGIDVAESIGHASGQSPEWWEPLFPFHEAAYHGSEEAIRDSIRAGVNLESLDDEGRTSLFRAAEGSEPAAVRMLLEAGADPAKPLGADASLAGAFPIHGLIRGTLELHVASPSKEYKKGVIECAELLALHAGRQVFLQSWQGETAHQYCVSIGTQWLAKALEAIRHKTRE